MRPDAAATSASPGRRRRPSIRALLIAAIAGCAILVGVLASAGDNRNTMEVVAHVPYDMGGDIQFQRRTGSHPVDGVLVEK